MESPSLHSVVEKVTPGTDMTGTRSQLRLSEWHNNASYEMTAEVHTGSKTTTKTEHVLHSKSRHDHHNLNHIKYVM